MRLSHLAAALFALLLAACNPMAQLDTSEATIASWHERYNEGDARALYGETGEEFRKVTSMDQMEALVTLVTNQMGPVVSTEREGFNINSNNGLTVTTVTMKTTFEKGPGTETFLFHGTGDDMKVVGWNVNSDNFMDTAAEADAVVPEGAVTEVDARGEVAEPAE